MRHLRYAAEAVALVCLTYLLLGWPIDRAIAQADGSVTWIPYAREVLAAGPAWTDHLYRFGVLGGSALHAAGGTPPLLQLCALLHLRPTAASNVIVVALQAAFGFFGVVAIEALATAWASAPRRLGGPQRVAAIWLCGFAPALGWRLAFGHENLVLGLLPWFAALALWWAARAGTLSITALVLGALAVFEGVSGLGPQLLVYAAVFGAPVAIASIAAGPAPRWGRAHAAVVLALAAGLLLALPRLADLVHYQLGDDAGRGLAGSLAYSYGASHVRDWLTSIPWSTAPARHWPGAISIYETNYPIGPLAAVLVLAWPRGASRALPWTLAAAALVAILFALDVPPVSTALLHVPLVDAFRVPARAILPLVVLVPPIALAALWRDDAAAVTGREAWAALAVGLAVVVGSRAVPSLAREAAAWLGVAALVAGARWQPRWLRPSALGAVIIVVAALGVGAFGERLPREVPHGRIEDGPAALRRAVLAQAPELALPLRRVEVVDAPMPFEMSTAFAAGLGSLDGAWFPPQRFLVLLGALRGRPMPPTAGVFALAQSRTFPILQQLYDVLDLVALGGRAAIEPLAAPPGPAWFPAQAEVVPDAGAVARALEAPGADVHALVAHTAWLLAGDRTPAPPVDPACARARVRDVTTDARGQAATIGVDAPAACTLVVATNYVHMLRATATVGGRSVAAPVFPVDVALVGIAVPRGASAIVLAPVAYLPWWSRLGAWLGVIALAGGLALCRGR